jgi:FKBP-type peptidyl-prolyl cis-trans isomerase 2
MFAVIYLNQLQILVAMKLKKHDFIEVEYTGRLEDGTVFDTTDEKVAKESGIAKENSAFGPIVICLGEHHILEGLEEHVMGKEPGSFKLTLQPDKAFGKKDAKLLKLMPMKVFIKQEIRPFPGLEVNIDETYGIVRTVSGGRVIVDFNHPLSGKVVSYDLKVNRLVEDPLEKAQALFRNELNLKVKLELDKDTLIIDEEQFPKELVSGVKNRIIEVVTEIKDVKKKEPSAEPKKAKEPVPEAKEKVKDPEPESKE